MDAGDDDEVGNDAPTEVPGSSDGGIGPDGDAALPLDHPSFIGAPGLPSTYGVLPSGPGIGPASDEAATLRTSLGDDRSAERDAPRRRRVRLASLLLGSVLLVLTMVLVLLVVRLRADDDGAQERREIECVVTEAGLTWRAQQPPDVGVEVDSPLIGLEVGDRYLTSDEACIPGDEAG